MKNGYEPVKSYPGNYDSSRIYYRNIYNPNWQQSFDLTFDSVNCKEAIGSLLKTGMWMGHLLKDGSCAGPEEPVIFAIGNRVNFEFY